MSPMNAIDYAVGFGLAALMPTMCHYAARALTPEYEPFKTYERSQTEKYQRLEDEFLRRLFYVSSLAGILSLIAGSFLTVQALSAGFIFGGIFSIIQGLGFSWRKLQPWLKFFVLLLAIVIITLIGYFKLAH